MEPLTGITFARLMVFFCRTHVEGSQSAFVPYTLDAQQKEAMAATVEARNRSSNLKDDEGSEQKECEYANMNEVLDGHPSGGHDKSPHPLPSPASKGAAIESPTPNHAPLCAGVLRFWMTLIQHPKVENPVQYGCMACQPTWKFTLLAPFRLHRRAGGTPVDGTFGRPRPPPFDSQSSSLAVLPPQPTQDRNKPRYHSDPIATHSGRCAADTTAMVTPSTPSSRPSATSQPSSPGTRHPTGPYGYHCFQPLQA